MVRLLACSFIWVLLIRPTVVKSNTPAEIKIMIIECIKSPWQGVFFSECVLKIRYWLTRSVFAEQALHIHPAEGAFSRLQLSSF